jgi:MFS family permease
VDLAGAVSATAGLTLLVYACSNAGEHGFASPGTWLSFLAAGLALGACVLVESRTPHPLFPPNMFRNRSFAGALAAAIAFGSIMGPSLFMLTFYLQNALGFGPLAAGAGFLPQEIAVIAAAPLIGTVIAKTGTKRVLAAGMVGLGAGVLTLAGLEADGSYWRVMAGLIFIGLGTACVIVGRSVAAMSRLSPQQQGLASGLWHAAPQIGAAVGLAVLISVADAFAGGALRASPDPSHAPIEAAVAGFRMAFLGAAAFAAIGLWSVLRWLRPAPASRDSER